MPCCQGLPNGPCPGNVNGRSVKNCQGDLFFCRDCEESRFPSTSSKASTSTTDTVPDKFYGKKSNKLSTKSSLIMALCHSCSVQCAHNCIGTVTATITFYHSSVKRSACLKCVISEQSPDAASAKLNAMCQLRWIEKHEDLLHFVDFYAPIVSRLEALMADGNTETLSTASQLFHALTQTKFVISVCVVK